MKKMHSAPGATRKDGYAPHNINADFGSGMNVVSSKLNAGGDMAHKGSRGKVGSRKSEKGSKKGMSH